MRYAVVGADGSIRSVGDLVELRSAAAGDGAFAWVDAVDPAPAELEAIQAEFSLHPLATEEATDAHERGKIEAYDTFWFIIAHALLPGDDEPQIGEVSIFAAERFVVTVRHAPLWPIDELCRRWGTLRGLRRGPGAFVYTILDTIVDGYLPFVTAAEAELDLIETRLLEQSRQQSRGTSILTDIVEVKGTLQVMRHAVGPMQDVIDRISRGDVKFFQDDEMVYYRSIGTHVKRLISRVDSLNDLVSTALTLNVSISSNRQADISRQLTIIATIFLPLSFITGFFGQNFEWLTSHITTGRAFLFWGFGTEALAISLLFYFFIRRRWL